jgi:hypothetical protein
MKEIEEATDIEVLRKIARRLCWDNARLRGKVMSLAACLKIFAETWEHGVDIGVEAIRQELATGTFQYPPEESPEAEAMV